MSRLLVLGGGWVGGAVGAEGARRVPTEVIDPPDRPELLARDDAARALVRDRVERNGVTAIVNACGRVGGTDAELDDANVEFVRWLVDTVRDLPVRLVHVGSASEYGDPGTAEPVREGAAARPTGAYATSKAAGTGVVVAAAAAGLDAVSARVFNIVGNPVPAVSPLHQWLAALHDLGPDGGAVEVWWPPTTRDFVAIDDVAASLVDLALTDGSPPPVVNVCSGTGLAYGDIVEALARRLGVAATVSSLERPGIESVVGDPSLLRETTGRVPSMDLERLAAVATGTATQGPDRAGSR